MVSIIVSKLCPIFFILSILLLFNCTESDIEKTEKPIIEYDQALSEISSEAAYLLVEMQIQKITNCMVSESINKSSNDKLSSSNEDPIKNLLYQYFTSCEFFTEALLQTRPVFEKIKNENKLPIELYVFSVFLETECEGEILFDKIEVGLFSSYESCQRFESIAKEKKLEFTKCHRYQ
jgi:hypothetical protein